MTQPTFTRVNESEGTPFRSLLPLPDRFRYIAWTLLGRRTALECRLRNGPTLYFRSSPNSDWETAYEIFRLRIYDTGIDPETVRRVVDVGGNVGYSCLFWCSRYPAAKVLTYEPHPLHCRLIDWHLRANGYSDRVTVIQAGAAARSADGSLVDEGVRSRIVPEGVSIARNRPLIKVSTVDFFETVGSEHIDILKIDIEGGEYELLQDPRFDDVASRSTCIVMEWHKRAPHHLGGSWCEHRLRNLGFSVAARGEESSTRDIGMLLAFRPEN